MKYMFTFSENNQSPTPKSLSCNNTARNTAFNSPANNSNLSYEPTSVLDIRRSPSPAADIPPSSVGVPALSDVLSQSDELPLPRDQPSDEWDALLRDLGLQDDSAPGFRPIYQSGPCENQFSLVPDFAPSQLFDHSSFLPSDFHFSDQNLGSLDIIGDYHHGHNVAHWNVGFDFVDELIQAAECVESNDLQLAQGILARLNQRLRSPAGKPLHRAAFYFKEALQSLLTGSNRPIRSSSSEIVQAIRACKAFSGISPIPMFSHFTATQALLEAVDVSGFIHVIDFDIGLGGKWAWFMKEIADGAEGCKVNAPVLRITAVVPEEFSVESRLIRESLSQFAHELRIGFSIDFVLSRTFEVLSFKAIKFMDGEKIAVHLSPATFERLGQTNSIAGFLSYLRRVSPHVVVLVDCEGWTDVGTASFRRNFINGLEFYTTMLDSLDAATGGGSGGGGGGEGNNWVRRIEMFLLRPKIFATVEAAAGRRAPPWREVLVGAGLRAVQLSQFADFQAECLLGKAQVRGFHVVKRQGEMLLCWHDRPLVATSAWRC